MTDSPTSRGQPINREWIEQLRTSHATNPFGSSVVILLCDAWLEQNAEIERLQSDNERPR